MLKNEAMYQKALRLYVEGRLSIIRASPPPGIVHAKATSVDQKTYDLGRDSTGEWRCTCPARKACYHLIALRLVFPKEVDE